MFCIVSFLDLDKVSFLLAISQTDFGKSIVKPRIKVGREFVNQGRNMQQVIQEIKLKDKMNFVLLLSFCCSNMTSTYTL